MGRGLNGGFPCRPLTYHILVGIRTNVDGIWWVVFVCANQPYGSLLAHGLYILVGNQNVVGCVLLFIYMRTTRNSLLSRI